MRTARAKGVPEAKVTPRHVSRSPLIAVVTVVTLDLSGLLGGSIVAEKLGQLDVYP